MYNPQYDSYFYLICTSCCILEASRKYKQIKFENVACHL